MLRTLNDQRRSGLVATTLKHFVDTVYLPYVAEQNRLSTYRGYRNLWKRYLAARCGSWWLRDVRTCEVQRLIQEVGVAHGIGRRSLARVKAFMSGAFNCARRQGFFDGANPVTGVAIPKGRGSAETHAYSLEEVMYIIAALPQPAATVAATAAFTGLRRAELQGLQWEDYSGAEIRVTRSVWFGIADEPKTPRSKAPVPVIEPLRRMVDAYRVTCGSPDTGAMFVNSVGNMICLNNLTNRDIQPRLEFCKLCGLTRAEHSRDHAFKRDESRKVWYGWHAFRRATNLYRLGVADKTIQAILRHSNLSTTMNVYVKSVDADSVAAMKKLEEVLAQLQTAARK